MSTLSEIEKHVASLARCEECPSMYRPAVVGRAVASKILLVGQAPGTKEPILGRPFAWTAGKTLFKWWEASVGWNEETVRERVYFAAVCRCFPGKNPKGGDRVPDEGEIERCAIWLKREFDLLKPQLVVPVGKLALGQFLEFQSLAEVIGKKWKIEYAGHRCDMIPLPHPSGASTWHRMEPGKTLLGESLRLLSRHPAVLEANG